MKYFIYARKATSEEAEQTLSIEAQLFQLLEFARKAQIIETQRPLNIPTDPNNP